jgi:RNA polymerase sigma factor (sigma-70 family)
MADDSQLLRHYVEQRSELAFAELVRRHLPLVYHSAIRQLGEARPLAEDVAQSVFVLLAEKSRGLLGHPSLAGWLHETTRHKVAHMLRAERRRQAREQRAVAMSELCHDSSGKAWERIEPVLDTVLLELNARDREAVLLRFFENCSGAELAARLCVSEAAAYKCVERALDRLRDRLTRRGITSSAAALASLLGAQGAMAAPAGLASTVTGVVMVSGLPVATALGGISFMSMKVSVGFAAAAVAVLGGFATYEVQARREADAALASAENQAAVLQAKLRAERDRIAREQAAARSASPPAAPKATATAKLADMEARLAEGDAFLRAHPDVHDALVNYYRTSLRNEYADVIAAMRLSPEEVDRFIDILTRGRIRAVGEHTLRLDGTMNPDDYTRQLKAVLGEARYQQFREHQQTGPARSVAWELTASLYYTLTPLAPAQIEEIKRVVQAAIDDRSLGPRYSSAWPWMPLPIWDRVLEQAGTVLSPPQVEALRDLHQQAKFFHAQSAALRSYHAKK